MLTMNKQRKSLAVLAFASALVLALSGCGGGGSEDPPASASSSPPDPSIADIAPRIPYAYGDSLASRDVQARETHQTVYVQGQ